MRKTGSTKIFVAVILAITVAIAVIVTASDLWDGASLATIFDDLAAPATTVIPNVSDVWSITLDAVDSTLSSEWLIPPAFALLTVMSPENRTVTEGERVIITFNITETRDGITFFYYWDQDPSEPAIALPTGYDVTTANFTAPDVDGDVTIKISITAIPSSGFQKGGAMFLTIRDSVVIVNASPVVEAGPDLNATSGQEISLTGATATDTDSDDVLTYAWTATPSDAVTFVDSTLLNPTITVSDTVVVSDVITLTLTVNDGTVDVIRTRELTIQDAVVVNTAPIVDAGPNLNATSGQEISLTGATATDTDSDDVLTYAWTATPSDAVTFVDSTLLNPTITVSDTVVVSDVITLTLTVNDGTVDVIRTIELTIQDAVVVNTAPIVDAGPNLNATSGQEISLTGATATDTDSDDVLTYAWTATPSDAVTFVDSTLLNPTITVSDTVVVSDVITLTLTVNDGTVDVIRTIELTIQDAVVVNTAPIVDAGPNLNATSGQEISLTGATATDTDSDDVLTYAWTATPSDAVTFVDSTLLNPTITVSDTVVVSDVITLTLTVNDGTVDVIRTIELNIFNPSINLAPTVSLGDDINVTERTLVTLTGIANDPNKGDIPALTYLWEHDLEPGTVVTGEDTESLGFTAPGIQSGTRPYTFTLTATDPGNLNGSDTIRVTVQDVPLKVSSAIYNPGNGQLRIIFNQAIASTPTYSDIHIRSADTDSGGIALSNITDKSYSGRIITATLSAEQQKSYKEMQSPQIDIAEGAVTDTDRASIEETLDVDIRNVSKKKSSSSATAPIVDLRTLIQTRIIDIPPAISKQILLHDDSDPLDPIVHNYMFDLPLAINGYYYLLDDTTNTLMPQTVTAGQSTEIVFTVYTKTDLAHFTLYLNMQGNDVNYVNSDTYITYTSDGTVSVTDPHGYIADATITVTQEDDSVVPEKKTVTITIYFDEPMGSTNMVAYMWNTDRKATFVKMIDALEVVAAATQTPRNEVPTASSSNSTKRDFEPDVSEDDRSDDRGAQSITKSGIVIIGDDDDADAQTLSLIRMWSGFASESITDAELLELLGLDYPGVDIPDWMMTELGALVLNGDVTVKEFKTALVYMLEMLTA